MNQPTDSPAVDPVAVEPIVEEKRRWSLVWLMPLVALCFASWLGWEAWQERSIAITILFENGTGIEAGRTPVRFNGLEVGKVDKVSMIPDLKGVTARVQMNQELEQWLTDKTEFWLVKPEISLMGVSGIETLLSGNYITFKPAKGKASKLFQALDESPPLAEGKPGLHITLNTSDSGSLLAGSPVYHRHIHVGEVERVVLERDGSSVRVDLFIEPDYQHLVHKNTRFWNVSGIHVSGPISNLSVQTDSLLSIIKGGVAFSTPEEEALSDLASQKDVFTLYSSYDAARTGVLITIDFPLSARIVQEGSRIMFHGVEAGVIKSYAIKPDLSGFSVVASMNPKTTPALVEGAQFWLVEPRITPQGVEGLETLLSGRYIAMDITERAIKNGASKRLFYGSLHKPPSGNDSPGLHLTLTANDIGNLSEGSSVWMRGFSIGTVEKLELRSNDVQASVVIAPQYVHLIREGVKFWRTAGVSISGGLAGFKAESRPLGAMVSGGITCEVPDAKAQKIKAGERFQLFSDRDSAFQEGKVFKLLTGNLKSIKVGTPVLYRGEKVGRVSATRLGNPADRVEIDIFINKPYVPLVTEGSRFWRVSGIDVSFNAILGVEVRTPSFETMLAGGIAFATPKVAPPAEEGYSFALHQEAQEEWEQWHPALECGAKDERAQADN